MKINVFLPCKKTSTRVKNKNKRPFANIRFGLVKIKLDQLIRAKLINKIYLSTNDNKIISFVKNFKIKNYNTLQKGLFLIPKLHNDAKINKPCYQSRP